MSVDLTGRHFLSMKDVNAEELRQILHTAHDLKLRRYRGDLPPLLTRKTLAMIFQKPSLRTRVSFESGMTMLGGHAIYLSPGDIKIGERERTEDIAHVLSRMSDLIMARVFGHDIVEELARHSRVPVINGLSDHEHPCQILADLQTVEEKKGRLAGLRMTYVGDGNNVCHSLMFGAAMCGMTFTAACPRGYEPKGHVLSEAQALGRASGATIEVVNDPMQGARKADVLYTDVWASMGQEAEAAQRRETFRGFQINAGLMSVADPGAIILHCLPAHYGEEIDYDTARTPNSAIFDQAENRLHAQNALMVLLAGRA